MNLPNFVPLERDVFYTTFGSNSRLELKNSLFDRGKLSISDKKRILWIFV